MWFFKKIRTFAVTVLEICAVLHVTLFMAIVNFSCFIIFAWLLFSSYWYLAVIYSVWLFYDRETPFKAGRNCRALRNWSLWKYLASYFPIKLHKTVDLDPSKNYLFAFHPHGLFVFGGFANFCTNGTGFDQKFPGLTIHFTVLNGQFSFPFYREYAILNGLTSGNPESIDYKLSKMGPGHSVWLAIGGAAEVLLADQASYTLKVLSRKGFIRRVLKSGALLVPVFSFNEQRLYDLTLPEKESFAYYVQSVVKFITNLKLPVDIRGAWQWAWFLVPFRRPINTVIGAPIDFAEFKSFHQNGDEDPPQDVVDKCHLIYLNALRKLYEDNKARFGDENTPLFFV